jgi:hypothetical protein
MKSQKKLTMIVAAYLAVVLLSCNNQVTDRLSVKQTIRDSIIAAERTLVIELAEKFLDEEPVTVTASFCQRSAGGIHDYFSEGTYWWPDPDNPTGPYIRKDGVVNPENFTDHLDAMKRLSMITGTLTSAYLLTGESRYAKQAMTHLNAWFADTTTMMNPHLLYAQAISGIVTGRGIGIIDVVHLIDVVQSAKLLARSSYVRQEEIAKVRNWFKEFTTWLKTHPYGIEEMNWRNNHGTWWHTMVSSYASFTEDQETMDLCRQRMKEILIPNQMAADGSFPLELERTRPYAYSLFNIDGMALLAHILTLENETENMWYFTLEDGMGMEKAVDFITYYVKNKNEWPFEPDVAHWDELPDKRPFLLLSSLAYDNMHYYNTWKNIPHRPLTHEGLRNLVLKNILLWIELPDPS